VTIIVFVLIRRAVTKQAVKRAERENAGQERHEAEQSPPRAVVMTEHKHGETEHYAARGIEGTNILFHGTVLLSLEG
jgi:hypothetical protein